MIKKQWIIAEIAHWHQEVNDDDDDDDNNEDDVIKLQMRWAIHWLSI
jgi:hypothetical protein